MNQLKAFFFQTTIGKILFTFISWFFLMLLTGILQQLFDLNGELSKPFLFLGHWKASGPFWERVKCILLLFIYICPTVLITFFFYLLINHKKYPQKQTGHDYGKMIGELSNAANDKSTTDSVMADKIRTLFEALLDDVCFLYSLKRTDIRASIVYREKGKEKLTSWRFGKTITPDQERLDLKAISIFLEKGITYPTWEKVKKQFENGDSETLFFIRNTGKLKLGILISVSKEVDTKKYIEEWGKIVYPFTMLGHMDKVVRFVVNYK